MFNWKRLILTSLHKPIKSKEAEMNFDASHVKHYYLAHKCWRLGEVLGIKNDTFRSYNSGRCTAYEITPDFHSQSLHWIIEAQFNYEECLLKQFTSRGMQD